MEGRGVALVEGGDRVMGRDKAKGRERIGISALSCRVEHCHFVSGGRLEDWGVGNVCDECFR
jgi:hypothetical protein